jgi:hypothetical protein
MTERVGTFNSSSRTQINVKPLWHLRSRPISSSFWIIHLSSVLSSSLERLLVSFRSQPGDGITYTTSSCSGRVLIVELACVAIVRTLDGFVRYGLSTNRKSYERKKSVQGMCHHTAVINRLLRPDSTGSGLAPGSHRLEHTSRIPVTLIEDAFE